MPEFGPYSSVAECEIKNYEQMLDEYYIPIGGAISRNTSNIFTALED